MTQFLWSNANNKLISRSRYLNLFPILSVGMWTLKPTLYCVLPISTAEGQNYRLESSISDPRSLYIPSTINTRCIMVSTDQADSRCFYIRISWILMEWYWFYFFHPLHLVQGLRSLKHWLLQKLSMKNVDQKFRFLIKKIGILVPLYFKKVNFFTTKDTT